MKLIGLVFTLVLSISFVISCKNENPGIEMQTSLGRIVVELFPENAPITTANFLNYTKGLKGFFYKHWALA